ncbi:hypothetical protein QCA50_016748 [Cerrena zonata]|uniref:Protein kinase domain-containing protein n=1 Tax=Cerrena zonata TaxID=2478898 RepID=A0AAW0FML6_9APHY
MTHPPHFRCYRNGTETFQLTYIQDLVPEFPGRAVFEAEAKNCETGEVTTVAVKFTNKYGRRGHELLAQNSLAPALRFCERVDDVGMFVVVTDFAEGESDDIRLSDERQVELLRQGINILHAEGLVWGDLRWPNVLVDEVTGNITLIDLDWCGLPERPATLLTSIST